MWDLIKRIYHFLSTVIFYSILAIAIIVIIMVGLSFFDQMQNRNNGVNKPSLFGSYVIITDSMVPSINPGDVVVTMRKDAKDIKKSDVITFISTEHNGVTVTHRVVGIFDTKSGDYAFRTKGDHNNVEDDELVTNDRILGKVLLVIPYLGHIQQFITNGYGWFILFIIPCLFIIIGDIIKIFKKVDNQEDVNSNNSDNSKIPTSIVNLDEIIKEENDESN